MNKNYALLHPPAESRESKDSTISAYGNGQDECCTSEGSSRDIVQFTQSIFVAMEDDGFLQMPIMRIGNAQGSVSFSWKTVEGSAKDGRQFRHASGVVTMKEGEMEAMISIPIVNTDAWLPPSEFQVHLGSPRGCALGFYLKYARVKVVDVTTFPSDAFKEQVENQEVGSINAFTLFTGFVALFRRQPGIWWRTVATMALDQLKNVYVYLKLVLSIYMVDVVFNQDAPDYELIIEGDRLRTAYVIAFLILAPVFILHCAERIKVSLDIHGRLRSVMSQHMFNKFMNYSTEARETTDATDMLTSLFYDISSASDGYGKVISLVRLSGKLAISIIFTLERNPGVWWATVLVPTLMIIWGALRTSVYIKAKDASDEKEAGLVAFINGVLNKIDLVAAYHQKPHMNTLYTKRSELCRLQKLPEAQIVEMNMIVPHLMGPVVVAFYTVIGAELVLTRQVKLGVYLATIQVFGNICGSFKEMFGLGVSIISTFSSLKKLTELFNKRMDLLDLRTVTDLRQETSHNMTTELSKQREGCGDVPIVDLLEIRLENLSFAYKGHRSLFKGLNFSCSQGKICAIRGASGSGRRTFLELLAHNIFPSDGHLFVPSHLRILYVSSDIVILNLSVWQNLTFGNLKGNNPDRVENILQAFEMHDVLALCKVELDRRRKEMKAEEEHHEGHDFVELKDDDGDEEEDGQTRADEEAERDDSRLLESLRESQKAAITLARALIMNPELMVLHRPFVHYHSTARFSQLNYALREHCANRGYLMPESSLLQRRPRSIFFTSDNIAHEEIADVYWQLPEKVGCQCEQGLLDCKMPRSSVSASMSQSVPARVLVDLDAMRKAENGAAGRDKTKPKSVTRTSL